MTPHQFALCDVGLHIKNYSGYVCIQPFARVAPLSTPAALDHGALTAAITKDHAMIPLSVPTRALLAALFLTLASPYVQAEWVRISTSDDAKVITYAEPKTILRLGTQVQLLTLTDYQDAQVISADKKFMSVTMQDEFNFDDGSGRHLNLSAMPENMGKGTPVAVETTPAPLRPILKASADAEMLQFACSRN